MKTINVALLLAIVFVVASSSGVMAAKISGGKYFEDTCGEVINPGPVRECDVHQCAVECARRFTGGVGTCSGLKCRCTYTCGRPPASSSPN